VSVIRKTTRPVNLKEKNKLLINPNGPYKIKIRSFTNFKKMKTNESKQFKLVFRYNYNPNYQPTPAEMETEGQKWGQWIGGLAQNGQFVTTSQLGYDGSVLHSDGSIVKGIHMQNTEVLAGDMIINAQDLEEALSLAKGSPILEVGGNVEVREVIPM
jgi:hypothetical protein